MPYTKWMRLGLSLVAVSCVVIVGCGPTNTQATFTGGTGSNPLDGGVLEDNGKSFTMSLNAQGDLLENVESPTGGVSFAREQISGEGGADTFVVSRVEHSGNTADVDVVNRQLTVNTASFGSFQFGLDGYEEIFGYNDQQARQMNQLTDEGCASIVEDVDGFCELVNANYDVALEQVIALAHDAAADAGIPPFLFGQIDSLIIGFFGEIGDFCIAWDAYRMGEEEFGSLPSDPCEALDGE